MKESGPLTAAAAGGELKKTKEVADNTKKSEPALPVSSSSDPSSSSSSSSVAGPASTTPTTTKSGDPTNFEYEDSEWDVGIGNLIIDLDADIEKNGKNHAGSAAAAAMPTTAATTGAPTGTATTPKTANSGKMAVHSTPGGAEPSSGLKMKIKRTKPGPGTRSSETKHEIVKTSDGSGAVVLVPGAGGGTSPNSARPAQLTGNNNNNNGKKTGNSATATTTPTTPSAAAAAAAAAKRDKSKEKPPTSPAVTVTPVGAGSPLRMATSAALTVTPVLPATTVTNGGSKSPPYNNNNNTTPPVTVTPVVNNTRPPPDVVSGLIKPPTGTPNAEPPSPPAKKWRAGHLQSDKVPDPSPPPPAQPTGTSRINSSVTLMAVTPPSTGHLVNGVHPLVVPATVPSSSSSSSSPAGSPAALTGGTGGFVPSSTKADACVGTCSASTMTEPDCLGPCEPGTAVTLEGIVWHETEGGVLVVNVTWRGKTYVGTLMDCTKNEWAPPRFCDSPTSDAESRAPKGRAKRGRGATSTPVPTSGSSGSGSGGMMEASISPMHSKLRNGAKGRRGGNGGGGISGLAAPPSPAKDLMLLGTKRKAAGGKAVEENPKRSRSSSRGASSPTTELAVAAATTTSSPSLIECPEPNCSKKYRHINGLKYHQSHAHSAGSESSSGGNNFDEDSNPEMGMKAEDSPGCEAPAAVPFTGKVPMPPPPETDGSSSPLKPSTSPRLPAPSPVKTATSADNTVIADSNSNGPAEHLFAPIVTQPSSGWTSTSSTARPNPTQPAADDLERKKHKKKNKDKDRERPSSKKSPPSVPTTPNGSIYHPQVSGVEQQTSDPSSSPLPGTLPAATTTTTPTTDTREEVQSPAYSDISDANDQSPSNMLLDGDVELKKDKLAEVVAGAPSPAAALATFGMYPFYGQPQMPPGPGVPVGKEPEPGRRDGEPSSKAPPPPGGVYHQPFGFIPPYPAFPMEPMMIDPSRADGQGPLPLHSPSRKPDEKVNKPSGGPVPMKNESGPVKPATMMDPGGKEDLLVLKKPPSTADKQLPPGLMGPTVSPYEQAMMYQHQQQQHQQQQHQQRMQQEDLRRFYNIYPGDDPMMGGGPPPGMQQQQQQQPGGPYPPMSSPSPVGGPSAWMVNGPKGSPHQDQRGGGKPANPSSNKQPSSSPKLRPPSVDRNGGSNSKEQQPKSSSSEGVKPTMETHGPPPPPGPPPGAGLSPYGLYPNPMYSPYGLPFDPSHPAFRSMMGGPPGPPHPFGAPSPYHRPGGFGPPPPGFGGPPSGEDLSRAHALEMLQHQANQYYAAAMSAAGPAPPPPPPPRPPSSSGGGSNSGGGGGASHKIHELTERAMKSPPASPASGKVLGPSSLASSSVPPSSSSSYNPPSGSPYGPGPKQPLLRP